MLSVVHLDADARRMGGGKSIGKQSSNVTQREAAPPAAPAAPMQQNAANSAAPKPAAAPNAAAGAPKKPWGAMLGGLAAGLGLAWLANSLGLGAAFGNFLLIALLALVVMVVIGMVMRARKPAASQAASSPFAFQRRWRTSTCRRADAAPVQPREGRQRRLGASLGAPSSRPARSRAAAA